MTGISLRTIVQKLDMKLMAGDDSTEEVAAGYASDILSDVLAKAQIGTLWVTNQKHQNIIAVAVMLKLAGVIIAGGVEPDDATLEKASRENVALFTTDMTMYEVAGRMYEIGVGSI